MTDTRNSSTGSRIAAGKRSPHAGFTLTELMISTLILLVVALAVFKLLSEIQHSAGYQAEVQQVLSNTRIAMRAVEQCIRQAGNDPLNSGLTGVNIISATEVQIRSDLKGSLGAGNPNKGDPDGDTDDSGENVTIRYNRGSRSLEIIPEGGPAQIVASHIADLSMQYYNAEGGLADSGNDVRTITVTISGSTLLPHPETQRIFGLKLSTNIRILT
jgi:prepilin-type N-terminal cleavage/methylation domain-containing protein